MEIAPGIAKTSSIKRLLVEERWKRDAILRVAGVPWDWQSEDEPDRRALSFELDSINIELELDSVDSNTRFEPILQLEFENNYVGVAAGALWRTLGGEKAVPFSDLYASSSSHDFRGSHTTRPLSQTRGTQTQELDRPPPPPPSTSSERRAVLARLQRDDHIIWVRSGMPYMSSHLCHIIEMTFISADRPTVSVYVDQLTFLDLDLPDVTE